MTRHDLFNHSQEENLIHNWREKMAVFEVRMEVPKNHFDLVNLMTKLASHPVPAAQNVAKALGEIPLGGFSISPELITTIIKEAGGEFITT
jgi:hypothetical protein